MSKLHEAAIILGTREEELIKQAVESFPEKEKRLFASRTAEVARMGTPVPVIEDFCERLISLKKPFA